MASYSLCRLFASIIMIVLQFYVFQVKSEPTRCRATTKFPSFVALNITFITDFPITGHTSDHSVIASGLELLFNLENTAAPYIKVNLNMFNIESMRTTTPDMLYVLFSMQECKSTNYTYVSNVYIGSRKYTLFFDRPAILVCGVSMGKLIPFDEIKLLATMLFPIVRIPINKYTVGSRLSAYTLYNSINPRRLIVCTGKYISLFEKECNKMYSTESNARRVFIGSSECGVSYSVCKHPNCEDLKFDVDKAKKCILTYQLRGHDLPTPHILLNPEPRFNESVQLIYGMHVPIYSCVTNLRVYIADPDFRPVVTYAFKNLGIANYKFNLQFVNSVEMADLKVVIRGCESTLLGVAHNSLFSSINKPYIVLCKSSNRKQLEDTMIHELLHLFGVPHDQTGLMSSFYSAGDQKETYIINIPLKLGVCTIPSSLYDVNALTTKVLPTKYLPFPGAGLYTNGTHYVLRYDSPYIRNKSAPLMQNISSIALNKSLTTSVCGYQKFEDAYSDSKECTRLTNFRFHSIPIGGVCAYVQYQFCTLIVTVVDESNQLWFVNHGNVDGLIEFGIIGDITCQVACLGGIQLFTPLCGNNTFMFTK